MQPGDDPGPDGVHLGLEAGDQHIVGAGRRPQADRLILEHGVARSARVGRVLAQHGLLERLAGIDRQLRAADVGVLCRRVGALGFVHAVHLAHPGGQRCAAQRLACGDVFADPVGDLLPACGLPAFERAFVPAEAPADGEVEIAGVVGNVGQMQGHVMPHVAENAPQELRLRIARFAQQLETLGRGFFQHAHHDLVGLAAARHIVALGGVELQNVAPDFFVETGATLLPQRAVGDQRSQHGRGGIERGEGVFIRGQGVLHGLDDVGHGVQADHVGGAEGRALGTAEFAAGEIVDDVKAEPEFLTLLDHRQNGEHAHAVGDKVRCVLGAHHALAQRGGEEGFEPVENGAVGVCGGNEFHQMHIARRVEEMHTAEAAAQFGVEPCRQSGDRQARGVGGEDGVRTQMRRDLFV